MKFSILGCGRWGSFIAWYLHKIGHQVLLWGRDTSEKLNELIKYRTNDYVSLSNDVVLTSSLPHALNYSDNIIIAIYGYELTEFMDRVRCLDNSPKKFILCMKELDHNTGSPLTSVITNFIDPRSKVAVCLGPAQPKEVIKGEPTCMVIDSNDADFKNSLIKAFNSRLINFVPGDDLIGNQIGACAKNIMGIAAGILDGLNQAALKGSLMVIGTIEIARLICAMGGKPKTAYGLCCLGDYAATMFSSSSNSYNYGVALVKKRTFKAYVPGIKAAHSILILCDKYNVEMPICMAVNDILSGALSCDHLADKIIECVSDEFGEVRYE